MPSQGKSQDAKAERRRWGTKLRCESGREEVTEWESFWFFFYFVILGKLYDNLNMQTNCVALSIKLLPFPVGPRWVISKVFVRSLARWMVRSICLWNREPLVIFHSLHANTHPASSSACLLAWATVRASHDWWNWQLRQHPRNKAMLGPIAQQQQINLC